jgi:hypothetical protein
MEKLMQMGGFPEDAVQEILALQVMTENWRLWRHI